MTLLPRSAVPGAIAALAAAVLAGPAFAADPIAGQSKFSQVCAACHTVASTTVVDRGRNNPAMIQNAINTIPQMSSVGGVFNASDLADIAAYLGNSPASISFAQTPVGQTSAVSTITISASRLAALASLTAAASGDFAVQGGSCGASVPAGTSCTVGVVFRPTASGTRNGALTINHNGISTPIPIALSGTANVTLTAGLSADASTIDFGAQPIGSASAARTVTLTNTGTAPLDFGSLGVTGANAGDFSRGGSCAVGTPLAVGATCTVTATFTPAAAGGRAATLAVAATAPTANNATANVNIAMSGSGQTAPAPISTLSTTSLAFGALTVGRTSAAQTVTITNSGNAALTFSAIAASGAFTSTDNCGGGVPAGGSCTVNVSFVPTGAGAATGSLSLASNAAGSPQAVALSGTGVLANTPILVWSAAATADFGTVTVGDDGGLKHFTLSNTGDVSATLGSFALAGDAAADYRVDTSSTCAAGASLAVGASCDLAIGFSPRAVGTRAATAAVVANNASLPAPLTLTGVGRAAPQPALQLSAATLDFSPTDTAGRPLTLTNSGQGVLHISALALNSARFSIDTGGANACGAAPFAVQPGASCQITLRWLGAGAAASAPAGTETGVLTLQGDMTPATATVTLNGSAGNNGMSNSGGGGCTIGSGTGAADPLLLVMAALSGLVLWLRRARSNASFNGQAASVSCDARATSFSFNEPAASVSSNVQAASVSSNGRAASVSSNVQAASAAGAGMGLGVPGGRPHAPWRARAWRLAVGVLLATATTLLWFTSPAHAADVGQPLAVSTVPGPDGAPVVLHDGKAKLTYVDFWASWCGPCRQSFPWMNRMQAKYGAQGLRIVAVNLDASRTDAQAFLKEVPATVALAFDPKGESARRVGVRAMPSSVLIGPDGRVLMEHAGFRAEDESALEARIAAALKTP
ncbi:choice-of-anchor D domain-containing protein [Mitsuaria sp. GD03876]|uniref:choice-of-anchor D domain-containing protein n=1 Tax=Mitsuaria sp. GD03876 TaxID=2975399 RepID=UPI002447422E|nr:choice-of-anchor D domain-containing protein [Mitsuaria sp. GD03876]MDH0864005.1 choice-of-anchor D domain-containing protein [Mitsuaria sp. GD03876]